MRSESGIASKQLKFALKQDIVSSMLHDREQRYKTDSFEFNHHYLTAHVLRSAVKQLEFKQKQNQIKKFMLSLI